MSIPNTSELLARLASEDVRAFEVIFKEYYSKVYAFAIGLVKEPDDADDITQLVFIKLWNYRQRLGMVRNLDAYLYQITRNTFLDFIEKRKLKQHEFDLERLAEMSDTDSPLEELAANELKLLVDMVVANMPDQRKRIYKLSREQGMSNQEIAEALNISKKTVENHLNLALKELKKIIYLFLFIVNGLGVNWP
jgi:RNA polymerase sigma-70 factor (ECF subfamily)